RRARRPPPAAGPAGGRGPGPRRHAGRRPPGPPCGGAGRRPAGRQRAPQRVPNYLRITKDRQAALAGDPGVVAEGLPGPAFSRHMLNVDPPDHTRLRKLVAPAFLPSRMAALEPSIQRTADGLLSRLEAVGPDAVVDLVAGFAHPLPFSVISE